MEKIKENDIQKQIKDFVKSKWIKIERMQSGCLKVWRAFVHFASSWHPDLVCYLRWWITLFIEVKRPGWKTSPDQNKYIEELTLLWFEVIVADNVDIVKERLELLWY